MTTGFTWAGTAAQEHPAPPAIPQALGTPVTRREWAAPDVWHGQQGRTPHCSAFAWLHWRAVVDRSSTPAVEPRALYREAKRGRRGEVLSLVDVYRAMERRGLAGPLYRLASLEDVRHAVLGTGPVLLGVDWSPGMMEPRMTPAGRADGAHAVLLDGFRAGRATVRNSLVREHQELRLDDITELRWEAWLPLRD